MGNLYIKEVPKYHDFVSELLDSTFGSLCHHYSIHKGMGMGNYKGLITAALPT